MASVFEETFRNKNTDDLTNTDSPIRQIRASIETSLNPMGEAWRARDAVTADPNRKRDKEKEGYFGSMVEDWKSNNAGFGKAIDPKSKMSGGERAKAIGQVFFDPFNTTERMTDAFFPKPQKPEKLEVEFARTPDEEANRIRTMLGGLQDKTAALPSQYDEQSRKLAPEVSALGSQLVQQAGSGYREPLPERQVTTSDISGFTRPVTQVDTSGITNVNTGRIGQAQTYQGGQGRDVLSELAKQLQLQAAGQGPSVAGEQFRSANEAALAASLAQQASLRGGFDPAAARQIRQVAGDVQAENARQAAIARMQEQLNAQQALGQVGEGISRSEQVEGAQNLEKAVDETSAEADEAQRTTDIAKTNATLEDAAARETYAANIENAWKNADFQEAANSQEFIADTNAFMAEAAAKDNASLAAYNGDVRALTYDISSFNNLVRDALNQGLTIEAAKIQFERELIQEGVDERLAQIRADNMYKAALAGYDTAMKARESGMVRKGVQAIGTAITSIFGGPTAGQAAYQGIGALGPDGGGGGINLSGLFGGGGGGQQSYTPTGAPMANAPAYSPNTTYIPMTQTNNPATSVQNDWGLQSAPVYSGPMR